MFGVTIFVFLLVPAFAFALGWVAGPQPLRAQDVGPRCGLCSYTLNGLDSDAACPECGSSARVTWVHPTRMDPRWWGRVSGALLAAHAPLFVASLWLGLEWSMFSLLACFAVVAALWLAWSISLLVRRVNRMLWIFGVTLLAGVQGLLNTTIAVWMIASPPAEAQELVILVASLFSPVAGSAVFNLFALIAMIGIGVRRARVNRSTPKA
ncbi:MAG: hypothetical protein SFY95_00310 [Planctomycetota bacterium]|nr:hypothetical protein [Planctomycetota bacterium]